MQSHFPCLRDLPVLRRHDVWYKLGEFLNNGGIIEQTDDSLQLCLLNAITSWKGVYTRVLVVTSISSCWFATVQESLSPGKVQAIRKSRTSHAKQYDVFRSERTWSHEVRDTNIPWSCLPGVFALRPRMMHISDLWYQRFSNLTGLRRECLTSTHTDSPVSCNREGSILDHYLVSMST